MSASLRSRAVTRIVMAASILAINPRYGPQWEQVRTVLAPRMAKLALQVDF